MAKIRIPVEQLPPPNVLGNHLLRFRIVSESKNEISDWSNLYTIKSIGQYRPVQSDVTMTIGQSVIDLVWDTPSIYNYDATLASASVLHNHSLDFKKHATDIFISWDGGDFIYHDRVLTDSTAITIAGYNEVRIVAVIATHGFDTDISGTSANDLVTDLSNLFLVFDTGTVSLV